MAIDTVITAPTVEAALDECIEQALEQFESLLMDKGATRAELADGLAWQRQQWSAWRARMLEVAKAIVTDPSTGHTKH